MIDVLGLGQCVVDRLALVDRYPGPDEKREFESMRVACGGPAATAMVALSRWGRACRFCGVIGDDDEGGIIRADLASEGVDASGLIIRPGTHSQFAFIAVHRDRGSRMIFWRRPTGAPPAAGEVPEITPRVFLTDGLFVEASVETARRLRSEALVVVDAGTLREGTEAMMPLADVFVASSSFARAWMGGDDPRGACERMRGMGVAVAGVTLGERGYVASFGDRWIEGPAHPVEVVDTTGCGDLFHAGLVEGHLSGWDWERSFRFAAWAAARCAGRLGTRAGIPARSEFAV
jgi:ribokinase